MRSLTLPRGGLPLVFCAALALGTMGVAGSWVGDDPGATNAFLPAITAWGTSGAVAVLWLAMAFGFGGWLVDRLGLGQRSAVERLALEGAVGVAAALALDSVLGTIGALLAFRGLAAWGLTLGGIILLIHRWRTNERRGLRLQTPLVVAALGPAIGILFLAAASEPGWLWGSEFRGYDALSYHLELPVEWLHLGAIRTFTHNVYSALPSFVEAAFLHIFALAGGFENGAISAQCLAALITLLAALNVACVARRFAGPIAGAAAACLYLGTPWIVVVGSLAYNDGFVGLFLAAGLLVILKAPRCPRRFGIALGILIAAACGAKLTAVGFAAIPIAVAALFLRRSRAIIPIAIAVLVTLVVLAPWLVRNTVATHNPVFPFLSGIFGSGHWSAEQVAMFARGHSSDVPFGGRLARLWSMWFAFGFGPNPAPGEPWAMQWSILPWLGVAGCAALAARRRVRWFAAVLAAMLVVQLAFWLVATHLQSRFLLPTSVLLAVAAASAIAPRRWASLEKPASVALGVLCLLPLWIYRAEPLVDHTNAERSGAPAALIGNRGITSGDAYRLALEETKDANQRSEILKVAPPAFWVNFGLPPETAENPQPLLLVGDATPFRYRRSLSYSTVWDRGPLDVVIAQLPDHPELWSAALRGLRYRYALVDTVMLSRWSASGWLNPALTPQRLTAFLQTTRPLAKTPSGVWLVELVDPSAPTQPPSLPPTQ